MCVFIDLLMFQWHMYVWTHPPNGESLVRTTTPTPNVSLMGSLIIDPRNASCFLQLPLGVFQSSLTTTEDGFIAVSGRPAATPPSVTSTTRNGDGGVGYAARGSRAPPLPARTPAPAPVANDSYDTFELFDQGGTYSSGSIRRSSGSSEYSGGRRSRGSSVPRNTQPPPPPSVVSSNVERWDAQGGRHRSSRCTRKITIRVW